DELVERHRGAGENGNDAHRDHQFNERETAPARSREASRHCGVGFMPPKGSIGTVGATAGAAPLPGAGCAAGLGGSGGSCGGAEEGGASAAGAGCCGGDGCIWGGGTIAPLLTVGAPLEASVPTENSTVRASGRARPRIRRGVISRITSVLLRVSL